MTGRGIAGPGPGEAARVAEEIGEGDLRLQKASLRVIVIALQKVKNARNICLKLKRIVLRVHMYVSIYTLLVLRRLESTEEAAQFATC